MCLTRNRRDMLKNVISNFQSQTYLTRELVIFNDHDLEPVSDLIPQDVSIREVILPKSTIGAKRALAIPHCLGDIVIHWDDDDFHSPDRMGDQVTRLLSSGKQVTGYHSFKAQDRAGNLWVYEGQPTFACGSSLCYFKSWALSHPFDGVQIGEDNLFCATANRFNQLSASHGGDFLIAGIHPGNTDRKRVECSPWKKLS
jgi:glycosyltransferase involved in cell wall biosynthesis